MERLRELLRLLEERLVQHDNIRKEVQSDLQDVYTKTIKEADSLEEELICEVHKDFDPKEEHILSIINRLNNINTEEGDDLNNVTRQAEEVLSCEYK